MPRRQQWPVVQWVRSCARGGRRSCTCVGTKHSRARAWAVAVLQRCSARQIGRRPRALGALAGGARGRRGVRPLARQHAGERTGRYLAPRRAVDARPAPPLLRQRALQAQQLVLRVGAGRVERRRPFASGAVSQAQDRVPADGLQRDARRHLVHLCSAARFVRAALSRAETAGLPRRSALACVPLMRRTAGRASHTAGYIETRCSQAGSQRRGSPAACD